MNHVLTQEIWAIFSQMMYVIVLMGAGAGCILSFFIFFFPNAVMRCNSALNKWVSTRRMGRALSEPIFTEPFVYRHPWIFSGIFFGFVAYMLYWFKYGSSIRQWISVFDLDQYGHENVMIALMTIAVLYALMTIYVFVVAVMLLVCPRILQAVGMKLDKWYSTRGLGKKLEKSVNIWDRWVLSHHRLSSIFLFAGSVFVLYIFWFKS